jgi:replicative DNA helicase
MGKTSLALRVAAHVAGTGSPVAFFSLEMLRGELVQRLLCNASGTDLSHLRNRALPCRELKSLSVAAGAVAELSIHIDDSDYLTVGTLTSKARNLKRCSGLGMIVVDHLGLMTIEARHKGGNRNEDLSAVTRSLKLAAKSLEVPILLLCQLSRECERRQNHRPILSDLRDSGAIEQDADVVLFVYRDEVYQPCDTNQGKAEIIIGKQRNGPVGLLDGFRFVASCAKFQEVDACF